MIHITSQRIDPGWKGKIVLELFNLGKFTLCLKQNMLIGALSFDFLSGRSRIPYNSRKDAKYNNQKIISFKRTNNFKK